MRFILAWELAARLDFFRLLVGMGGREEWSGRMDGVGQGRK